MAVQIKIPGVTFTDADDLPVVRTDSIFPAQGALALIDPTHPVSSWSSGVPANGGTVPNVAWEQAAAMLGSGTEGSLAASIYNVGLSSTQGLVERSGKGGLHAIVSPTVTFSDATVGFNVAIPTAIFNYIRTNSTHKYYASVWQKVTRAASTASVVLFSTINSDANYALSFSALSNQYLNGTLDTAGAVDDTVGNRFRNMASTPGNTGSFGADTIANDTTYAPSARSVFLVGNRHNNNGISSGGARRGKGGSRILYRYYLEDLTVSGRTYAQVDTLDRALFAALCNTAGGRYYGDTFTDPATIA